MEPDREWWPWLVVALVVLADHRRSGRLLRDPRRREEGRRSRGRRAAGSPGEGEAERRRARQQGQPAVQLEDRPGSSWRSRRAAARRSEPTEVVALTVSKGTNAVAVPNTVSLSRGRRGGPADRALGSRRMSSRCHRTRPAGTVVAQSPSRRDERRPGLDRSAQRLQGQDADDDGHDDDADDGDGYDASTRRPPRRRHDHDADHDADDHDHRAGDGAGRSRLDALERRRADARRRAFWPTPTRSLRTGWGNGRHPEPGRGDERGRGLDRPPERRRPEPTARRSRFRTSPARTRQRRGGRCRRPSPFAPCTAAESSPESSSASFRTAGAQAKRWAQVIIYVGR